MNLTNTKNSELGRAVSFDASYIGRIRSGKRGIPKHQPFLEPAAAYFARNLKENYQRKVAADVLCPGKTLPEDREALTRLITAFLLTDASSEADSVGRLILGLSNMPAAPELPVLTKNAENKPLSQGSVPLPIECFYGNAGKRQAVDRFLTGLLNLETPIDFLFHSDEDMSWLYEDPSFAKRWAFLLIAHLRKGSHIRIIHEIGRDVNEMMEAVQKWLPIYMEGDIEPWYYPRIRDGLYHRSLFVASSHAALVSDSVGHDTEGMLNLLIQEPAAVNALEQEFRNLFSLCKSLMSVHREGAWADERLSDLLKASGTMYIAAGVPWLPDPEDTKEQDCIELIHLPEPSVLREKGVRPLLPGLTGFADKPVYAEEFSAYLERVLDRLTCDPHFFIRFMALIPDNIVLIVKEFCGAFLNRASAPFTSFYVQEQGMTSSFYEYLYRLASRRAGKEESIRALRQYMEALKD